ncbi:translation initiation factor IF-2 [Vampirovibrio chlorellavorus]|uniref:translation initiation factor IF-2 n=1 Tax=Vampirovibrio chlorellavorus TaxID=758823 RepID=UPI0026EA4525|nr:translation initiation factor IF-2 [Vampirovibrio chlorellavorus]
MTSPKVRVHEISKILGVSNAAVIDLLAKNHGVQVKSHSSTVDQAVADRLISQYKAQGQPAAASQQDKPATTENKAAAPEEGALKGKPAQTAPTTAAAPKKEAEASPASKAPAPQAKPPHTQPLPGSSKPSGGAVSAGGSIPASGPSTIQRPAHPAASAPQAGPQGPPQNTQGYRPAQSPNRPGQQRPGQGGQRPGGFQQPQQRQGQSSRRPSPYENRLSIRQKREEEQAALDALPKVTRIDEPIVVRDLAEKLRLRETEIIKHLFMKGMMVTVNQTLDVDFAKGVAKEFGFEVEETAKVKHEGEYTHLGAESKKLDESKFQNLQGRAPVVSIMGHVDHGKTTLLDSIRESRHKVVDSEAGGITQSIGAYTVEKGEQRVVFLDTPGHEAFTSMRMRGAQSTDIAILVVAADDGVMPQTIEAINHAKAAKIPIIVAVNKIDKADADPDRVLVQLADYGLSAEKWGGDTLTVEVSALQKLGLDDLLDSILLVSELLELKADATVPGEGIIIEAQLDKRMGPVATALVQNGNLKVGDNVLIGSVGGRVRALIDDHGSRIQQAGPSTPVEILGLDGVPNAGDAFRVVRNDKEFKQSLAAGKQKERDQRIGVSRSVAAGFSGRSEIESDNAVKENQFNLLVKADTQGSLEAVVDVLQRMTNDEVKINIVHSATGDISEADVMLASTANALIIAFNAKVDTTPQRLADQEGVTIKRYDVIYHITEEIEKWVLGQLEPETEEVHTGSAEVRQIFKVGKTGTIAGCMVTSGKLIRNAKAVVLRNGKEIFSGTLNNLKRFKDDVKEVATGYECGISFDKFQGLQEGDVIDVFTTKALERTSL